MHIVIPVNFRNRSLFLGSFADNLCCLFLPAEHFAADAMFALMQADTVQSETELITHLPLFLTLFLSLFFIHPR